MTNAADVIQLAEATISVLHLTGGEVLVLHYQTLDGMSREVIETWLAGVNTTLREQGKVKVSALVLLQGETVEALDEAQMRAHGWVRAGSTPV